MALNRTFKHTVKQSSDTRHISSSPFLLLLFLDNPICSSSPTVPLPQPLSFLSMSPNGCGLLGCSWWGWLPCAHTVPQDKPYSCLCLQSARASDGRSSTWGYLEGITDSLEREKNWTAWFRTALLHMGPLWLLGTLRGGQVCVLSSSCPGTLPGVWGNVSFTELPQSKGFAGLEWLQKLFWSWQFYTWPWKRSELLHCVEKSLCLFLVEEIKWAKWEKDEGRPRS